MNKPHCFHYRHPIYPADIEIEIFRSIKIAFRSPRTSRRRIRCLVFKTGKSMDVLIKSIRDFHQK